MTRHEKQNGQTLFTFPGHKAPHTTHDIESPFAEDVYRAMTWDDNPSAAFFDGHNFTDGARRFFQPSQEIEADLHYGWHSITPAVWALCHDVPEEELSANEYGAVQF